MDADARLLQEAVQGRYTIERELGRGGMAVVYLASDARHPRRVAIKVMRDDVSGGEAADRFLREVDTIASLTHPHILPLLDSGRVGDRPYYVMPYIEGESLRGRLTREGQLPLADAMRIVSEVADALAFAHSRGVVHRDIKPENILLDGAHAYVADFGVARAVFVAAKLTETGVALGTPAYMSPEQAMAERVLDGRADQYALACVLYEMLSGEPPFTARTSQALMLRHAVDPVPSIATVRQLPAGVEEAILRALSKSPADRFPGCREFVDAVRLHVAEPSAARGAVAAVQSRSSRVWVGGAFGLVAVAVAAFTLWGPRVARASSESSIAVLPLAFSGTSSDSMLAYGLHEQLTQALARVPGVRLPSFARAAAAKSDAEDPAAVGRALGVETVLTGRLYVLGDAMRVFPELVRTSDGAVLWTTTISGTLARGDSLADWFLIQDQVAREVVAALLPRLSLPSLQRTSRGQRTTSVEALRLYSSALALGNGVDETTRALELLTRAVAIDSTYSDAWAQIAVRSYFLGEGADGPAAFAVRYKRALDRALRFDPENSVALAERGWYAYAHEWDWDQAIADMHAAHRLNRFDPWPLMNLSSVYQVLDAHVDSGVYYARRAVEVDSLHAFSWNMLGKAYMMAGDHERALEATERSFHLDSTHWNTNYLLFREYLDRGRLREADLALERLRRAVPLHPPALGYVALMSAWRGDRRAAVHIRDSLARATGGAHVPLWIVGIIRLSAGDTVAALDALEEAIELRSAEMNGAMAHFFGGLTGTPRFDALVTKVFQGRPMRVSPYTHPPAPRVGLRDRAPKS